MNTTRPTFQADLAPRYSLEISVGNPFDHHGQTRVRISGGGALRADCIRGGPVSVPREARGDSSSPSAKQTDPSAQHCQGELGGERTSAILQSAVQFDWGTRFPPRPGIPGEAIVVWKLKAPDGAEFELTTWLHDAEKDPRQSPVLETIGKCIREFSRETMIL